MKKLLIKMSFFLLLCLGITCFFLLAYGANIDYFYNKFTTPKAKSMIIGDSRSLQGIQPQVINDFFESNKYELPMFNYSFTIAQAIIGPPYNESIERKLDENAKNGLFILSLTPEMLTSKIGFDNANDEFREADQPPHNMSFVSMNPNFEYLFKNSRFFNFKAAFRKKATLHKDGWLEESNLPKDTLVLNKWKKGQIASFLKDRDKFYISRIRLRNLDTLIKKLQNHGEVFVVRMPIDKDFLLLEKKYYPEFNRLIDSITTKNTIKYFDFNLYKGKMPYQTYDGHHINKYDGKKFTRDLCDSILKY
ncbi:hypothetical protein [Costertonia aggregata]|uniref:SGNH/GDSL hydrolase family protein n=1 Tax=Costertonia aggregata TaxID=343403 RepID=A0A7H9ATB8_9FLAO|nr:hypothetical protein [Costertonia aggregata]QLG46690.1 hypothetical protein HYG79_15475 [Costertonia aggregata]